MRGGELQGEGVMTDNALDKKGIKFFLYPGGV